MEPTTDRPLVVLVPTVLSLLQDGGPGIALDGELRYDVTDPYAVHLVIGGPDRPTSWIFARELLVDGQLGTAGLGDIQVWPASTEEGPVLLVELATDEVEAVLSLRLSDVRVLLDRSDELVRPGTEADHCDIDSIIAAALAGV